MDQKRAAWLVVGAAVLWGTTGTAQALGGAAGSPVSVGALRLAIGAVGLLIVGRRSLRRPPLGWLALASLAMAAYQVTFFAAVARTGVALGTVVALGTAPIFAGALAWFVRSETPSRRWVLATGLAIAGVILVAGKPHQTDLGGLALAVGAGLSYAIYALGSKYLIEHLHPTGAMAIVFSVAALALAPLLIGADLEWLSTAPGFAAALWLGLGATTLSYVLFARGLKGVPMGDATTLTLVEPATAAALGVVVLHERPGVAGWLGILLVMGAVTVLGRGRVDPSIADEPRSLGA